MIQYVGEYVGESILGKIVRKFYCDRIFINKLNNSFKVHSKHFCEIKVDNFLLL